MLAQNQILAATGAVLAKDLWAKIWKTEGVIPKVKLFLWKAVLNALPVGEVLHKRIRGIDRSCRMCAAETETVQHMLFFCSHARAVWFSSPLGLCTDTLQGEITHQLLQEIWQDINQEQVSLTMYIMWALWKSRCDTMYGGKNQNPCSVIRCALRMSQIMNLIKLFRIAKGASIPQLGSHQMVSTTYRCWVDGSFKEPGKGGAAYVLMEGDRLI